MMWTILRKGGNMVSALGDVVAYTTWEEAEDARLKLFRPERFVVVACDFVDVHNQEEKTND